MSSIPALDFEQSALVGKTNNRSVLGSMNEYAFQMKCQIAREGGLERVDIDRLNLQMNKMPMGALKYEYPIDAVVRELEKLAT